MPFTIMRDILHAITHRQYDMIPSFVVPEKFNWVRDVFEPLHVAEHPEKNMLELVHDDGTTDTVTYKEALDKSNQLLNFLRSNSVQKGDTIFVMCGLHTGLWISYLSIIKGGFIMIPVASIMSVDDVVYRFQRSTPKVVITDKDNVDKTEAAMSLYEKEIPVKILLDDVKENWHNIDAISAESNAAVAADTNADDVLFWFFTSGTTGLPKVVAHTHASYPLGHLTTAAWIGLKPDDKHYNISQPGWAKFAWSCFFAPLNIGCTVFIYAQRGRFNPSVQLKIMEQHKVTTLCCPPTVLRMLIQEPLQQYHFSFCECVSAGEPLNPEVIEAWRKGTGIIIRDGYGQTESTCMIYNLPDAVIRFGSMGKPGFLYDTVIADEDGNEKPLHEEGQIAVRMNNSFNGIFKAYIGDETRQKEVFKHGLYYTGDKAYKDEDGYIWFVGRSDDVIKSSDYRIGPFEVESILIEIEEVLESAVVGSPHALKGQEVKAFVVLNKEAGSSEELAKKIFDHCRQKMAPYKMPRIIEFVQELPKTISGKIRRVELRAMEAQSKARNEKRENEFYFGKGIKL
ncbi:AMP-binding protein [Panacibacter ginsenosidivorans]|uniref:AMP-binding protein n=1 Tax=Panacibacter ginsenosidivorans TaxID=1813871 RepID=A0A5B8V6B0_9BACT|nr:AMP-binding protein [Panacibacter ginsenosidivorans]QEC66980.1 AMP-binding protein [Panacibacter ginsenosidivorans]